jgi:cytochrome c biogenesis protein CcdA
VLAAALIVSGIAIVDSLNPGTVAPALALAVSAQASRRIIEFGLGILTVNVLGGVLIVLGPGAWLFDQIPSPSGHLKHVLALVAGIALVVAALGLLIAHERLTRPKPLKADEAGEPRGRSAFIFGAGLALAELPTAFPYFAALAAIDAADVSVPAEAVLVVVFNVLFLLPVFLIAGLIAVFPTVGDTLVEPIRRWMSRHWTQVLATVLGAGGSILAIYGARGL